MDKPVPNLKLLVTGNMGMIVFILVVLVFYTPTDEAVKGAVIGLLTLFASKLNTIYDFMFGSSRGSKAKDDMLTDKAANTATVTVPITGAPVQGPA